MIFISKILGHYMLKTLNSPFLKKQLSDLKEFRKMAGHKRQHTRIEELELRALTGLPDLSSNPSTYMMAHKLV